MSPLLRWTVACLLLALGVAAGPAQAGVELTRESAAPERFVLTADRASLREIIDALAAAAAFEVRRVGRLDDAGRISGTYAGTLDELLPWLLRDRDFLLVREAGTAGGEGRISRLVLMNAKAVPGRVTPPPPPTVAAAAPATAGGGAAQPAPAEPSALSRLLQRRLGEQPGAGAAGGAAETAAAGTAGTAGSAPAAPQTPAEMAEAIRATTERARQDLETLVEGLRNTCPGGTC